MYKVSERQVWYCMRSCNHKVQTVYTSEVRKWLSSQSRRKVTKKNTRIISKAHARLQTMEKTLQSFKNISIKWGCAHEVPTFYILRVKKWLSSQSEKSNKYDLTIIYKPHAHPTTIEKTHAEFHSDQYKTVRGDALIRGIHCLYTEGEKWLSSQCEKSDKNISQLYPNHTIVHPHTMKKTHAKFQNDRYKTVRGVTLTWGTHCLYFEGEKWLSSQCEKKKK